MNLPEQSSVRNCLLQLISQEAFAYLRPGSEAVDLNKGDTLLEPDAACEWAYFPDSGLASVVTLSAGYHDLEIGLFGREGMSSTALVLGAGRSPHRTIMQMAGAGHRIPAGDLRQAMERFPDLKALLLRYVETFLVQVAQTALSNGGSNVEDRLARWLLLAHDRMDGDDLRLTHKFLSIMLGVRRSGVTIALQMLEGRGLIRARRGLLTILDRQALEAAAAYAYGPAEREYERLVDPSCASDVQPQPRIAVRDDAAGA